MILSGSSYQHIESREIDVACEKIKELLRSKGKIDLPFIINELKIPTETAIKAVNKLRAEGYIKFDNE
ncbi:MAG TPA: hypothetical protein VJH37_04010 [Candidatus Nanoarchaeia archaeon]|nr:hypothetical protein [Candidatus Nanoarchaeia archaeon]